MARTRKTEDVINSALKAKRISEIDILLLKHRSAKKSENLCGSSFSMARHSVYVTHEQAEKGYRWLRNFFLTKDNHLRHNRLTDKVGDFDSEDFLKAIGFDDEGKPLKNVPHDFKFLGLQYTGNGFCTWYEPIYEINGVQYYVWQGVPTLY